MNFMDFFNPSTFLGALTIGIIAGLISGGIIGFCSGKVHERKSISKSIIKQKGSNHTAVQNSKVEGGIDVFQKKNKKRK